MPSGKHSPAKGRKKKNGKAARVLKAALRVFCFFFGFLALYAVAVIADSPEIDPEELYSSLNESSVIYDKDGEMIDTVHKDGGSRIMVSYADLPRDLVDSFVAIEDKTFWEHHGFNVKRIFGAIADAILHRERISGTSTITQQLARNVYLPDTKSERSLGRKIAEAWYTVRLEMTLSKKDILEAYLNTIYLGNSSYGVGAAARSYFSKDVKDLDLCECAALASIPKSPNEYALVKTIDNRTLESEAIKLKRQDVLNEYGDYTIVYNGDVSKDRRELTLRLMNEQGMISGQALDEALGEDLKPHLRVDPGSAKGYDSCFADYVVNEVLDDLVAAGHGEDEARAMIYTGGLKIYSTMDRKAQEAVGGAFDNDANFPGVDMSSVRYDGSGNIVAADGSVLYYKYGNYFSGDGEFKLNDSEYTMGDDGSMYLLPGRRLRFVRTETDGQTDYSVRFRQIYTYENGKLYSIDGGVLLIPAKYKTYTDEGTLRINASFFGDYPDFFKREGSVYTATDRSYQLSPKVRQPQAAMVICDNRTGEIRAMAGGRGDTGRLIYNRADNPRQPGSAIKPLSVYSTALEAGEEASAANTPLTYKKYDKNDRPALYGEYWTASSMINDAPMHMNGKLWPRNVYKGYKGIVSLRKSIELSINVNAVRVFMQLGTEKPLAQLKEFGISTAVEEGDSNDRNAAALALGGMTRGISPLEMASAYTAFPNGGIRTEHKSYTKVLDSDGNTILTNGHKNSRVISGGVAFIMTDIMKGVVSRGTGKGAAVPGQPTAGKTGTTTSNRDAWFCGFTPGYTAALWIGNDVNLELTEGSHAAVRLWSKIMAAAGGPSGAFPAQPADVKKVGKEYYIAGTERSALKAIQKSRQERLKKQQEKKLEEQKKKEEQKEKEAQRQKQQAGQDAQTLPDDFLKEPLDDNSGGAAAPQKE